MIEKTKTRLWVLLLELFSLSVLIGVFNLFFFENPGFLKTALNPYIILSFLAAAYYGRLAGYMSFIFSSIVILLIYPPAHSILGTPLSITKHIEVLINNLEVSHAFTIPVVYLLGLIRENYGGALQSLKNRFKNLTREKWRLIKETEGLKEVYKELEERISRQHESITLLYSQIQKLNNLRLYEALKVLLEIVENFTEAERASVWQYSSERKALLLHASIGYSEEEEKITVIPIENTIEGWVFRNNQLFSARMLLQYEHLRHMSTGRNVYTIPIRIGHRVWGVLNVEDIAFRKYNTYTERILSIIFDLASSALEKAAEWEALLKKEDIHPATGIPMYSQFYRYLEQEIPAIHAQKGTLSMVIVELVNYEELLKTFNQADINNLIVEIASELRELSGNAAHIFHYKENNQLALVYPNMDHDGVSLFCLSTLEKINTGEWKIDHRSVDLEVIVGFSSMVSETKMVGDLQEEAEKLLEMQKV